MRKLASIPENYHQAIAVAAAQSKCRPMKIIMEALDIYFQTRPKFKPPQAYIIEKANVNPV